MIQRNIIQELKKWADKRGRKPLVLRGARQVGKTTAVKNFSSEFDEFISLNLERPEDRAPFEQFTSLGNLIQQLFLMKNKEFSRKKRTLIFIDEIQEVPDALNVLRYFYEEEPGIHVITAGSLLESLLDKNVTFPVGRVEYLVLRPVSFSEFLNAMGENAALKQFETLPLQPFALDKLFNLFHTYALIGGMPEAADHYSKNKNVSALASIYESLLVSYLEDVEKYAANSTQSHVIRHVIKSAFAEAGNRIKFNHFGFSNYGSRETGEAFRTLERAFILQLIYPLTTSSLPLLPDRRKSPRLHVLDTGLLNYLAGIQKDFYSTQDLSTIYRGKMIEHLVGQELLAMKFNALNTVHFWAREKQGSTAEVDYIYQYNGKLIPIEVKSGAEGKLKSLHLYMESASHELAVRFYRGDVHITPIILPSGKKYFLLNLPYFLVSQLEKYLEWFEDEVKNSSSKYILSEPKNFYRKKKAKKKSRGL